MSEYSHSSYTSGYAPRYRNLSRSSSRRGELTSERTNRKFDLKTEKLKYQRTDSAVQIYNNNNMKDEHKYPTRNDKFTLNHQFYSQKDLQIKLSNQKELNLSSKASDSAISTNKLPPQKPSFFIETKDDSCEHSSSPPKPKNPPSKSTSLTFLNKSEILKRKNYGKIVDERNDDGYCMKQTIREVKYNIFENRIDDYVNTKRKEIYARMKVPKALVNHYLASSSMLSCNGSYQNPYGIFRRDDKNASKNLQFNCFEAKDISEHAKRLDELNENSSNLLPIRMEKNLKNKGFGFCCTKM
ncbi:unnamed protein product [Moneuplotes crassus]|uniref:Uncharacterized protein n=1 Tax=Euplotes crassus TaxID=5936 RepID=A0AAD1X6H8_EUPCR|nr:unnamed protein product [Moneuplotes crassus]